jgi:hypothetical protein
MLPRGADLAEHRAARTWARVRALLVAAGEQEDIRPFFA